MTPRWASVAACERCWALENGERSPIRLRAEHRQLEVCDDCGMPTRDGIFVRRQIEQADA